MTPRALQIYNCHNQPNAIDFANRVVQKFPFRFKQLRTQNGYEFQARFHW